ncbi:MULTISPECIES: FAD/NAD(P)-binding protein [unclassified Symbiopectobacterium]|uniref:FAD/NAD(P)-binding protein n=1 Tax=unclassified Symbiopectobacterium TaxID=2794573 RepID=UPI002225DECD|nr:MULTISPECIES: FAD/NAD(P)-binding protein [unclassified Symbiopectobacterium]MCW2476738.1 FAD/NAD(P)-binding protein [Candidatus Symbiopectobacterium sp. NZEC151]MCW2482238.1 FAD/NAD(P)-binding protein [Candidatus Symbiopectobacterium sp. NZEC135]
MKNYAIVGSGYAGLSVLFRLLELPDQEISAITLFDTPETLAVGHAFGDDVCTNLLNRPVKTMYFREAGDFGSWLKQYQTHLQHSDDQFVPRTYFGQFLRYQLILCKQRSRQRGIILRFVPKMVVDLTLQAGGVRIYTQSGENALFSRCFLCTGTTQQRDPYGVALHAGYFESAWPIRNLRILPGESVGIIGSRLSAHDVAIALAPHCRKLYFISRQGLLPRRIAGYHNVLPQRFTPRNIDRLYFVSGNIAFHQLFRLLRLEFAAQRCSLSDFLRNAQPSITAMSILLALNISVSHAWRRLSLTQRARFIARWQSRWQQLRVPIAIPNALRVEQLFSTGKLDHLHGDISITPNPDGFTLSVSGVQGPRVNKLINASGISACPYHYPLIGRLISRGIGVPHPFGGIRICPETLSVISVNNTIVPNVKCIGQMTVGEFFTVGNIDILHEQAKLAVVSRWNDTPHAADLGY